jgi:hypothetical protein
MCVCVYIHAYTHIHSYTHTHALPLSLYSLSNITSSHTHTHSLGDAHGMSPLAGAKAVSLSAVTRVALPAPILLLPPLLVSGLKAARLMPTHPGTCVCVCVLLKAREECAYARECVTTDALVYIYLYTHTHHTALHDTTLHYTSLHYTSLHLTTLHFTALHTHTQRV